MRLCVDFAQSLHQEPHVRAGSMLTGAFLSARLPYYGALCIDDHVSYVKVDRLVRARSEQRAKTCAREDSRRKVFAGFLSKDHEGGRYRERKEACRGRRFWTPLASKDLLTVGHALDCPAQR